MKRIVIVVSGGVVQRVYGPKGIEVELLDYDDADASKRTEETVSLETKAMQDKDLSPIY